MHSTSASVLSALALLVATSATLVQASSDIVAPALSLRSTPGAHRRHHSAVHSSLKQRNRKHKRQCKSSSSGSQTTFSGSNNGTASTTAASGSSSGSLSIGSKFLSKNGIHWGYLPDDGDAGGSKQTMAEINSWGNSQSAFYGYYAQAHSGTTFTGSQLLSAMSDIKASGAIFQPAVMPTGGWQGLTADDNSQAVNIAKVMKQFTDEGIEVWLRFAHEVNWYQTDGTYTGGVSEFQAGWKAVSDAMDEYAPDVKMFFTPNVASESQYDEYYPQAGRVDIIGIDYYPHSVGTFVNTMKSFHDKYTSDTVKFALGETGLGYSADISTRLAYVAEITSDATKEALPNFIGASWFNYMKGYDFRIISGDNSATQSTVSFFAA